MIRWRGLSAALALAVCCVWTAVPARGAASSPAPAGSIGHDVSYPQCGGPLPTGGAFGVVGINGGRAFSANPCLADQWAWAEARPHPAMAYVNTGNPGTQSVHWPTDGTHEGALCIDADSAADPGCAYIYGSRAAAHALDTAQAAGVPTGTTWWLDVEVANSWDGSHEANAAALQGAYDQLRQAGVAEVGLYSTGYQWGEITGSYTVDNAATYELSWAPWFTPSERMANAPVWVAGVTADAAARNCGTTFTGGSTRMAQYIAGGFDHNLVCGQTKPPPAHVCDPSTPAPAGYAAVYGTPGDDDLVGSSAREIFYAGDGHDRIRGAGGADILCGGPGHDILLGGSGGDRLYGGTGRDDLRGGGGPDRLIGNGGADQLRGGQGEDDLRAGGGNDALRGGTGPDRLDGQRGRDHLNGGPGTDRCRPGGAHDPPPINC